MAHKVEYQTLAIMKDGTFGNINQGNGTIYTDAFIEQIPNLLNEYLVPKKLIGIIKKIESVKGNCLTINK
jgi:hypothetical protein